FFFLVYNEKWHDGLCSKTVVYHHLDKTPKEAMTFWIITENYLF
ncbi:hypothetical protein DBR06_SOUSAS6410021, partial [Sousa chinensis]